ncbi:MAG: hypothetical protein QM791_12430 [Ferruginibacter sp.]
MKFQTAVKEKLQHVLATAFLMALPFIGFSQPGALPSGPEVGGGEDQNPDAVPFDSNMTLVFLGIALAFVAVVMIRRARKAKATA